MKNKKPKAFTLIEIIVALSIFSIVAVVALGALVKIISANKKAQTLQAAMTNVNFAFDAISRDLRVGSTYYCRNDIQWTSNANDTLSMQSCAPDQGKLLAFESSKIDASNPSCRLIFVYRFVDISTVGVVRWQIEKAEKRFCTDVINQNNSGNALFVPVTSSNVVITDYRLGVSYDVNTQPYPRAFIRLVGFAGTSEKEKTYFDLQTVVSPRVP